MIHGFSIHRTGMGGTDFVLVAAEDYLVAYAAVLEQFPEAGLVSPYPAEDILVEQYRGIALLTTGD